MPSRQIADKGTLLQYLDNRYPRSSTLAGAPNPGRRHFTVPLAIVEPLSYIRWIIDNAGASKSQWACRASVRRRASDGLNFAH